MSAVLTVQEPSAQTLVQEQPQQAPLLRDFDVIAQAPGGVVRLRELILTLAVQGKLVPQDPRDEPASVLLKKIREEKDRLIAEGKIKRDKPLAEIAENEQPFGLPSGWEWAMLDDISVAIIDCPHSTAKFVSSGLLCIDTNSFKNGKLVPHKLRYVDDATFAVRIARLQPQPGDLVFAREGSVGESVIIPAGVFACLGQRVMLFRFSASVSNEFIRLAISSNGFVDKLLTLHKGIGAKHVNVSDMKLALVPLPPLAEQSRIVARVEELMCLCDALEAKGRLEAAQHAQLVSTLLATLSESETPEQLAENWQRIATHFDLLLDRPKAVDALEQTILQLAVRGLLVPQDPQDEPASELLKKIRTEKHRLVAEGKIKRDKPLPLNANEEKPFNLPQGWRWARFPDLCAISGGATPSKAISKNWEGTIPWVSPKDMKVPLIADAQDHVSDAAVQGSLSLIPSGSLLMVVRGMILAHSFPVALTLTPVTINQDMKALTPLDPSVPSFLALLCHGLKPEILALIDRSTHGTCKLESPKIFGTLLPIPPLAEQSRIVTRVTALRGLCADLRARLIASQSTQAKLTEAMIGEAVPA